MRVKDFDEVDTSDLWDLFLDLDICSEETLQVVTDINGYTSETFADILYATEGLRSLEQLVDDRDLDPDYYDFLFEEGKDDEDEDDWEDEEEDEEDEEDYDIDEEE